MLLFGTFSAGAVTVYSIANGVWGNTSTWSYTSGGPPCGCFPGSADNIIINHNITLDRSLNNVTGTNGITGTLTINAGASLSGGNTYDVDIRSGGTLNLCGTLVVRNMTFSNGSFVNVCSTGVLTVNGNFENKNNSDDVVINGTMTVGGSFTNGNGGVISGSGSVTITNGPVTNTGSSFGCEGVGCTVFPCGFSTGNCGGVPLPINLVAFDASCNASGTRTLRWTTASEVNNSFFSVERSSDAIVYVTAGIVSGAGTTSQKKQYSWTDDAISGSEILYYRLRQTDYDGQHSLSHAISIRCFQKEKPFILYPVPASDFVLISGPSATEESMIRISDTRGKIMMEQRRFVQHEQRLDVSGFCNGIYILTVSNPGAFYKAMLVITR